MKMSVSAIMHFVISLCLKYIAIVFVAALRCSRICLESNRWHPGVLAPPSDVQEGHIAPFLPWQRCMVRVKFKIFLKIF